MGIVQRAIHALMGEVSASLTRHVPDQGADPALVLLWQRDGDRGWHWCSNVELHDAIHVTEKALAKMKSQMTTKN